MLEFCLCCKYAINLRTFGSLFGVIFIYSFDSLKIEYNIDISMIQIWTFFLKVATFWVDNFATKSTGIPFAYLSHTLRIPWQPFWVWQGYAKEQGRSRVLAAWELAANRHFGALHIHYLRFTFTSPLHHIHY